MDPAARENALATVPRIGAGEAMRLVEAEGAVLVDVREAEELARTGRLSGALHIPLGAVPLRAADELPRDRPILLYCAAGVRSAIAGKALQELGYGCVLNLGGFAEAAQAGMPTEPAGAWRGE